ncbi:MAG TPA: DNA methyltransferase [Candidatus Nanoarchaeia archaeon]|nr:DNA methyltransferase [Candidatus Nanoarchaeia archaeon]
MKIFLFVLGRDPELSKAEIEAYFENRDIKFDILESNEKIAAIRLEKLSPKTINDLGGTIKIAEVISSTNIIEEIEENLEKQDLYRGTSNKAEYYVSAYATRLGSIVEDYLKDYFKRIRVKAVQRKGPEPTKLVKKQEKGEVLDIVVYKNYIAKTIAVTDLKEIKQRDLNRPSVDYMKVISIRLAKILINLSKAKEGELIADPFCGSGTILQEALLKGINAIGIDKDKESIKHSRENLEWLKKNYNIKADYKLYNLDSRKISTIAKKIDSAVTEPYLGPYIRKLPTIWQARQLVLELRELYYELIKDIYKILKTNGRLVIIIPRIKTLEGKTVFIDFENLAKETGYELVHKPITYGYSKSKIGREIYILEKI